MQWLSVAVVSVAVVSVVAVSVVVVGCLAVAAVLCESATGRSVLCKKPFRQGIHAFGCGQCLPCRINRRRIWTHRLMLESAVHGASSFITLTYAPENLPENGTLVPEHLTLWLKRFRRRWPTPFRYYAVGEYGEQTWRPHYHVLLFGVPTSAAQLIADTWGKGHVHVGQKGNVNKDNAGYIVGYVTKKMTKKGDKRLGTRHPEFARMSTHPGIGAGFMAQVADALNSDLGIDQIALEGDVPGVLQHGGKKWPLGRYLRRRLRDEAGFTSMDVPEGTKNKASAKLWCLHWLSFLDPKGPEAEEIKGSEVKRRVRSVQVEKKDEIYKKRRTL